MKQRFIRDPSSSARLCHSLILCNSSHYDIAESMVMNETDETFRVDAHNNVCHKSYFFLKICITPFKMPNYPFGGIYPQVKNH